MSDFPEELYAGYPFDTKWIATDFDDMPEGTRVAIYVFAGIATVKVRREALLIDEESKIVRTTLQGSNVSVDPVREG